MTQTLIITGASGFLGQTLVDIAESTLPRAKILPVYSPRLGGIDLVHPTAPEKLGATIRISNPQEGVLIHAAAVVEWDTPDSLLANAAMALNVARWARSSDIAFCVLVSSASVYSPLPLANTDTPCQPATLYGLGKWAGEHIWRLLLPQERTAIVRLAGIWGWQPRPTLFWNRLLLAAVRGSPPEPRPIVRRMRSRRNYISDREACECLLLVGVKRMPGLFLGAGRDIVDTQSFVRALQELPGSKLSVDWQDDGGADDVIFHPSAELLPWLKPFSGTLPSIWASRPNWVL